MSNPERVRDILPRVLRPLTPSVVPSTFGEPMTVSFSDTQLLRLQRLAAQLGRTPTKNEMRNHGIYRPTRELVVLAGLPPREPGHTHLPKAPLPSAGAMDRLGLLTSAARLRSYHVPVGQGAELNPLESWME